MPNYVCPFGKYCAYGHNKKIQPNNLCFYYWVEKCTETNRKYNQLSDLEKMIIRTNRKKALRARSVD